MGSWIEKSNRFLLVWSCLLPLAMMTTVLAGPEERPNRPNLIFLLTDDQRINTFGTTGPDWLQTPHIDELIEEGVHFGNAYIAEPTCSPSRTSFFTGMYERVHGVGFSSSYRLNEEQWAESYPALLRKNGYFTGFIGKFGVEYYTFRGNASEKFDYWRGHDGWASFFPNGAYADSQKDIITPIMGESMERFLDEAPGDQPFCLSVSFSVPHGSQTGSMWKWNEPASNNPKLKDHPIYSDLYRDRGISIPDDTGTDPYRYVPRFIMNQKKGRANRTYSYNYSKSTNREHHIRYYQQITGLDHEVGQLMDELRKKGIADETVIIFASDHGLLMGEYGMGGKGLLYDLTAKIPCFIYDPRLSDRKRGRTVNELVLSLDVTSTLLDYANIEQPSEMQGRSLVPLVYGKEVSWRNHVFLENLYTGRDTPFSEGIRKGKWKYIRMYHGVDPYREQHVTFTDREPAFEQLFDLKKDPRERNNLIDQYEGSELLRNLRKLCREKSTAFNRRRAEYRRTHKITPR